MEKYNKTNSLLASPSLEELNNLGRTQRKAFRNLNVTDGYRCVVLFSRSIRPANPVHLELQDFAKNEERNRVFLISFASHISNGLKIMDDTGIVVQYHILSANAYLIFIFLLLLCLSNIEMDNPSVFTGFI